MSSRPRALPVMAALAIAVAGYSVAAWAVTPGFFDGPAPPELYRFVSPPPGVNNNAAPPQAGRAVLKVASDGRTDPGSVFTAEPAFQAGVSVLPGAFSTAAGTASVTLAIDPVRGATLPDRQTCTTNVYQVTASAPLVGEALVQLRFTDALPAPSAIFRADSSSGPWTSIGSTGSASPYYLAARSARLGYFVACFSSDARSTAPGTTLGGGQTLPLAVAGAIILVLLGGIPFAVLRRRRAGEPEDAGSDPDEPGA